MNDMDVDYSFYTGKSKAFSVVDYVLFSLTLAASLGIGLVFAIKDRKKMESEEYLLGGRKMYAIPVALSLLVTFMSALTLLGTPAEIYNYTTMYWWLCASFVLAILMSGVVFIPFFFKLGVTSVFEYLEMRFNKAVRILGVVMFLTLTLVYMSLVLYAPSLALNAVTGINLWGLLVSVALIATIYTAVGGMKAVLWTDTLQAVVIAAGLFAVLIQGSIVMGGFQNAWDIAANRSRIYFHDFSVDPTTRHSVWTILIGGGSLWLSNYGVNQAQVQRALSCPSIRKAQIALFVNLIGLIFIVSMCCMIGIVMFAFYADCHHLQFNNLITSTDLLLPLYVMDILGHLHGLPGVFVSCIISGGLSSLSSGFNAISAVISKDLIQPFCCRKMSDRAVTILCKIIVFVVGGLTVALAFVVSQLGSVMEATYSVTSVLSGPMFGLFVLGMFFPWANSWGALAGGLTSVTFMVWICIGAYLNKASTGVFSSFSTDGCNWNVTTPSATLATTTSPLNITRDDAPLGSSDPFYPLYELSYLNYSPTAVAVVVVVGLVVSFITGKTDPKTMNPRLICPLFDRLFPCLPEMILGPLRCGVNYEGEHDSVTKYTLNGTDGTVNTNKAISESYDDNQKQGHIREKVESKIGRDNPNFIQSYL
ncbi:sodium-coupled monocarboxylate transporter 1-like [Haliotis rufescens]|uniref:sodium-coupled monocarboxylate transporter 1-like n=1 Tax=Haliotis rufescens TaxID=6454 RepID=UPI00201F7C0A|nr:sodium-coupled monocarboxylate transporter 1-like [Haliotis rufescens]